MIIRSIQLPVFIIICFISIDCSEKSISQGPQISDQSELDSILDFYVDNNFYPFIYARLEDVEGNLIYEHSSINTDLLPNTKIDGNTWIRIWSMSKIVTISIALDLIEEGVLNFNDPVSKYIPEFKNLPVAVFKDGSSILDFKSDEYLKPCSIQLIPNDSVMTIGHLINHTSGFYYATTGISCIDSLIANQNLPKAKNSNDLINKIAMLPLIQHSGTNYFYGINTTVLGLVAERASKKNLKQLVEERITIPMNIEGLQYGISNTEILLPRFTGRDSTLRVAINGELDIFGPDVPEYSMDYELFLGGEGMIATADGYADFIRMLLKRGKLNGYRFLNESTVEDIYAPHTQLNSKYGYNGYNLWVSGDTMRKQELGEAGLWIGGGYECTYFWADPKRNFVGIIMSQNNEVQSPGYKLNDDFRGALYRQLWALEK